MLQVWARDPDRVRRGLLTPVDATCVLRESGVGTWQMSVEEATVWSPTVAPGWGVVVVDDGAQVFSGPITGIGVTHSGSTRTLELSGVTDMVHLKNRPIYPSPTLEPDAQTAAHRAAKGFAEDLITLLVNENAGPGALAWRQTSGLASYTSQGRGAATSINARFSNLLEEVQALATVGGLVVDCGQAQDSNALTLRVRTPVDKTRSVRFMAGHGLGSYELRQSAPDVTTVLVAGQGEGAARTIAKHTQTTSWGQMVEVFQDRRDTNDLEELAKAGAETLAEGAAFASATFNVTETTTKRFGADYQLGDTVTVALPDGPTISDGVRVAEIRWDEHGREVTLTVGERSAEEEKAPAWVKKINHLQRQVRRLEAAL